MTRRFHFLAVGALMLPAWALMLTAAQAATPPLLKHVGTSRYFSDPAGKTVYLTGSHYWQNLQDYADVQHPFPAFDWTTYLNFMQSHNHNFMRLWEWETASGAPWTPDTFTYAPLPYAKSGARYDLNTFNQAYFDRLRQRVIDAGNRGMYVSVMLFEGWSIWNCNMSGHPYVGHPFNKANNIQGVDGDPTGIGEGYYMHTLDPRLDARVNQYQKAYVKKVIDTVNDLDNVLYEIANESQAGLLLQNRAADSKAWQYDMISTIKTYEAAKPKQHPVGMTAGPGLSGAEANTIVMASSADWVSPAGYTSDVNFYQTNPPATDGSKVVFADTDHIFGSGGDRIWIWKTFTRGFNPIYMDSYIEGGDGTDEGARVAMGQTLTYAQRISLAQMVPNGALASTQYALASAGSEYLVFQPGSGNFTLNLSTAAGSFTVEWFNPTTGSASAGAAVNGGTIQSFTPPFTGPAVLYLKKSTATVTDTTLPTVAITAPVNNATLSGTTNITAAANDDIGVTKTEFYVDGVLKSTAAVAPYSYSWNTGAVSNGAHAVMGKAYDAAGNVGNSINANVTVANVVSTAPLNMPPLLKHVGTSRYFSDPAGNTVYVTGSHYWQDLQDYVDVQNPLPPFDWTTYLNFMQSHNHNFMRLWEWETAAGAPWTNDTLINSPMPFALSGARYDLNTFNQAYFDRMRQRIIDAGNRGIYVSIMLFEGWNTWSRNMGLGNPYAAHPFNKANNIQGVDGDPTGIGEGYYMHTLDPRLDARVNQYQKAYVKKVIDTVSDLDNVLYEIANESDAAFLLQNRVADSKDWQYDMINFIKSYEAAKPKQHPVGMTAGSGLSGTEMNTIVMASPADWVSPHGYASDVIYYRTDPPATDGTKVVLADTDHIFGAGGDQVWIWKCFTRGFNPIYMDSYIEPGVGNDEGARVAMGQTLTYSKRIGLAQMVPNGPLSSTQYALANPGSEYLVLQPASGNFSLNLSSVTGSFTVEWFNMTLGSASAGASVNAGANQSFTPPFTGPAVLYLKKSTAAVDAILPTVSITSPVNNATLSGTVNITAAANDDTGVTRTEFYVDGVLKSTVTFAPYSYSWDTTAVINGAHVVMGKAYDAAGNVGISSNTNVTVANVVSTAPLNMPALLKHVGTSRYFSDPAGKTVYLTGSHYWQNLQDYADVQHPFPAFDWTTYLNFMQSHNHNFMRLWEWETASGAPWTPDTFTYSPLPYAMSGARYDLNTFNQAYFDRLRQRVIDAGNRGMYVSVMLFEGWSIWNCNMSGHPYVGHPFNKANNIQGVDGDPTGIGEGYYMHTLDPRLDARVNQYQKAYVKKVIDTVNDLDNVLYEIANESQAGLLLQNRAADSKAWQYDMISTIKTYEAAKPKQHPIGMTAGPGLSGVENNTIIMASSADWVSPAGYTSDVTIYQTNPPATTGAKVVLADTDHIFGSGGDRIWIWKTFTRGFNPIYMDSYIEGGAGTDEGARVAMGQTLTYSKRIGLAQMIPNGALASTQYALASAGSEYLVFQPGSGNFTLNLSSAAGSFTVEWFNPTSGLISTGTAVNGGATQSFTPTFTGPAVLYLKKSTATVDTTRPTAPTSLALTAPTTYSMLLSWTAATDNVAVTGYRLDVARDSAFSNFVGSYNNLNIVLVTSYTVKGLAAGTPYYARLRAFDAAGNVSVNSAVASAKTLIPLRINAGGALYTDSAGQLWMNDADFSGGGTQSTTHAISGTSDPVLYQAARYGVFTYTFQLANGGYTVNLRFAEILWSKQGQRLFNIVINGQSAIKNFDIIGSAGSAYKAITKSFAATVTNGQLTIQFVAVKDNPTVNAIEILSGGNVVIGAAALDGSPAFPLNSITVETAAAAIRVGPNPWRADRHTGPVMFTGLAPDSTIKIFSLDGRLVRRLQSGASQASWDLKNDDGDRAASGIYIYVVTDAQGTIARGKVAVIK